MFRSSGPVSFGFSSLENASTLKSMDMPNDYPLIISNSPPGSMHSNSSLKNELQTSQVSRKTDLYYTFNFLVTRVK